MEELERENGWNFTSDAVGKLCLGIQDKDTKFSWNAITLQGIAGKQSNQLHGQIQRKRGSLFLVQVPF